MREGIASTNCGLELLAHLMVRVVPFSVSGVPHLVVCVLPFSISGGGGGE